MYSWFDNSACFKSKTIQIHEDFEVRQYILIGSIGSAYSSGRQNNIGIAGDNVDWPTFAVDNVDTPSCESIALKKIEN